MRPRRLPRRRALLYASASLSGNLVSRVLAAWLFFFYAANNDDADVVRRIPVWAVGVILTIVNVLEALDDPLIGHWSDRTRSRWGRRLPFIVLSTPLWGIFLILLFTPPVDGESFANAVYLLIMLQAFRLLGTLSGSPLESLLPSIAPLNVDRVRVVVGQVTFGTIGAALALVGAGPLIDLIGFQAMAAIAALVAVSTRLIAVRGVWHEAKADNVPSEAGVKKAFVAAFHNDQFLYFLPTFTLFNMGITLMTAALPFFVEEVINPREGRVGTYTSLLAAMPIAVVLLSLPLVQRLALRHGKAWVYSHAMLFGGLYLPLLFFMGFVPGLPKLAQGLIFLAPAGVAMSAVFVFPNALMADIIDYDAARTGSRREGVYYGAQNVVEGAVVALHAGILATLLAIGGTTENPIGIRLVGPVAGLSILAGYLVFRRYTLPDQDRVAAGAVT